MNKQKTALTIATILILAISSTLAYQYGYHQAAWNTRTGNQPIHLTSAMIQDQINNLEYGVITINVSTLITETIYLNKSNVGLVAVNGAELIAACNEPLVIGHRYGIENVLVDVTVNANNHATKAVTIYNTRFSEISLKVYNPIHIQEGTGVSLESNEPWHSTAHNRFPNLEILNMHTGISLNGLDRNTSLVCNNLFNYVRTWWCTIGINFVKWADSNYFTRMEIRNNQPTTTGIIYNSHNPLNFMGVYQNEIDSLILELPYVTNGYGFIVGHCGSNTINSIIPVIAEHHEYLWIHGVNKRYLHIQGYVSNYSMADNGVRRDIGSRWWTPFIKSFIKNSKPVIWVQSLTDTYHGQPVEIQLMNYNTTHFQVYLQTHNGKEITEPVIAITWHATLGD